MPTPFSGAPKERMASFRMALLLLVKMTADETNETKIRITAPSAGMETSPSKFKKSSKTVVGGDQTLTSSCHSRTV